MGSIEFHQGDLFSTRSRAIGHGVNVKGLMGAGIALQFKKRFPDMFRQYNILCRNYHLSPGEVFIYNIPDAYGDRFIYNIASQNLPGPDAKMEWLVAGMRAALQHATDHGVPRIAIPRIASGIGGLDQEEVAVALTALSEQYPVVIEVWSLN